ncbi:MAG: hypothetical protein ACE5EC_00715 [Phycisphaerae bacterium]
MTQLTLPVAFEPHKPDSLIAAQPARSPADRVALSVVTMRHYRIGPVALTLRSTVHGVVDEYHRLYRNHETADASANGFRIDVVARRSRRTGLRHFHILAHGEQTATVRRRNRILPHVEGAINLLIARHLPHYLQIHASALSRHGIGAVFPGSPGAGKSTLAAALLARGWAYATDEFALIDPDDLRLVPYPRALSIKSGSVAALSRLGLPMDREALYSTKDKGPIRCLAPSRVRPDGIARTCPVRLIVFPEYGDGAAPAIEPMSRAEAVFRISRVSFNFLKFRDRGIELLTRLVRGARCYRLQTGDLEQSCRLVEACLYDVE